MTSILSAIRPGVLAYRLYFAPRAFLSQVHRQGALNKFRMWRGMKAMEAAAYRLPTLKESAAAEASEAPQVHFLTGAKYWYQAAFCTHSMIASGGEAVRPVIYDDGSLTRDQIATFARLFPHWIYVSPEEIARQVDRVFPEAQFPTLRERRINYPHIRKLTDIHGGREGWRLVLDSDMLFFRRANFLYDWLQAPSAPCHMVDVENAYGYTSELMEELAGAPTPDLVNVGILGLQSDSIDWRQVEEWATEMIRREGTSYLQEQGLAAMIMAKGPRLEVPARDYVCKPGEQEGLHPRAVLHHYVHDSKKYYFDPRWRAVFAAAKGE